MNGISHMNVLPAELYNTAQVRELDHIAIQDGIPGYVLMSRAGEAAFNFLCQRWPQARRIAIVCGGGNNGGDGYVLARLARKSGLEVLVLTLTDLTYLHGDTLIAWQDACAAGVTTTIFNSKSLNQVDILVDAILGTGLERDISGHWLEAIDAMNKCSAEILSIDVPSGLNADTGAILGSAIKATATITFIGLKRGLFTGEGPSYCGQITFSNLGIPSNIYTALLPDCWRYSGEDLITLLPRRQHSAYKSNFGHVLVVGGNFGLAGAARMAAEAAARCGAGLVSVATRAAHAGLQAAIRPELMIYGVETPEDLSLLMSRATVIAVGPGLGCDNWSQAMLNTVFNDSKIPTVVDADGLNLLAVKPTARDNWILTPHPGEAARLLRITARAVEIDRFKAVRDLSSLYGGIVVLKGAGSLIASKADGLLAICSTGNPGMASGGMGDVLTGVISGLLAQGLQPFAASKAGVYLHGLAGDLAAKSGGERGLMATDLFPFIRQAVNL
jgi:NAD(P)H-hydrate epimerase